MSRFNFKRGSATKRGAPIHRTIIIPKGHSLYPYLFDIGKYQGRFSEVKPFSRERVVKNLLDAPEQIKQLARDFKILPEVKESADEDQRS